MALTDTDYKGVLAKLTTLKRVGPIKTEEDQDEDDYYMHVYRIFISNLVKDKDVRYDKDTHKFSVIEDEEDYPVTDSWYSELAKKKNDVVNQFYLITDDWANPIEREQIAQRVLKKHGKWTDYYAMP